MKALHFSTAKETFFPLTLSYKAPDGGREWILKFQSRPTKEITFSGDYPTRDEIIECLAYTNFPFLILELIEVVIADAIAKAVHNEKGQQTGV